jgi:hypothetical protein
MKLVLVTFFLSLGISLQISTVELGLYLNGYMGYLPNPCPFGNPSILGFGQKERHFGKDKTY